MGLILTSKIQSGELNQSFTQVMNEKPKSIHIATAHFEPNNPFGVVKSRPARSLELPHYPDLNRAQLIQQLKASLAKLFNNQDNTRMWSNDVNSLLRGTDATKLLLTIIDLGMIDGHGQYSRLRFTVANQPVELDLRKLTKANDHRVLDLTE